MRKKKKILRDETVSSSVYSVCLDVNIPSSLNSPLYLFLIYPLLANYRGCLILPSSRFPFLPSSHSSSHSFFYSKHTHLYSTFLNSLPTHGALIRTKLENLRRVIPCLIHISEYAQCSSITRPCTFAMN